MDVISDSFGIHETALRARTERIELLARNVANADTPHFKARDLDFKALFAKAQTDVLTATNAKHFTTVKTTATAQDALKYRVPFNTARDGNTVEMGVEQAQFGKAATEYRASLMFIENNVNNVKRALRGE